MKITKIILSSIFIAFLAISCGGGGDGDGGDGDGNGGDGNGGGGTATGTVNQESIDDVVDLLTSNISGCTAPTAVAAASNTVSVGSIINSLSGSSGSLAQAVGVSEEIPNFCETGSATLTTTTEQQTSVVGNIVLASCAFPIDGDSVQINGPLNFSLQGPDVLQFNINQLGASSSGIDIVSGSAIDIDLEFDISSTVTLTGSGDLSGLNATITSFSLTDNLTSEVFSLTGISLTATGLDTDTVTIDSNGSISTPDGSFSYDTTTPLMITTDPNTDDILGLTGQIEVDGGNNSQIQIAFSGAGNIDVQADTDGNGAFEITDSLDCSGAGLGGIGDILPF